MLSHRQPCCPAATSPYHCVPSHAAACLALCSLPRPGGSCGAGQPGNLLQQLAVASAGPPPAPGAWLENVLSWLEEWQPATVLPMATPDSLCCAASACAAARPRRPVASLQVPPELYRALPLALAPVLGNPINLLAAGLEGRWAAWAMV